MQILIGLMGSVIGFFVVRWICAAWLGLGAGTSTTVASVVAALNLLLVVVGAVFLKTPSGPDANTKGPETP